MYSMSTCIYLHGHVAGGPIARVSIEKIRNDLRLVTLSSHTPESVPTKCKNTHTSVS